MNHSQVRFRLIRICWPILICWDLNFGCLNLQALHFHTVCTKAHGSAVNRASAGRMLLVGLASLVLADHVLIECIFATVIRTQLQFLCLVCAHHCVFHKSIHNLQFILFFNIQTETLQPKGTVFPLLLKNKIKYITVG